MSEWPSEQEYKYYLHGVKTEQERIIKLLEKANAEALSNKDNVWQNGFSSAIELINGETNV